MSDGLTLNRFVVLITPLIATVVTSVLGVALKWLDGWEKHEARMQTGVATPTHLEAAPSRAA